MHKSFITIVIVPVVLSACTQLVELPPDQVMIRVQQRGQELQSVRLSADGTFEYDLTRPLGVGEGEAHVEGTMQDGGKQIATSVDATITAQGEGDSTVFHALFESIVVTPGETYLKLHEISSEPPYPLLSPDLLGVVIGQWWILPSEEPLTPDLSLTPSPQLIRAQAEVVRVIEDLGIHLLRGRHAYHYRVEVDPEKLRDFIARFPGERDEGGAGGGELLAVDGMEGHGELWVDARTFDILRIEWTITSLPLGEESSVAVAFTVDFTDHNGARPIAIPEDAKPFTMQMELTGEEEGGEFPPFPSEWEEELVEKLLRG